METMFVFRGVANNEVHGYWLRGLTANAAAVFLGINDQGSGSDPTDTWKPGKEYYIAK